MKIGSYTIGNGQNCFIIAEAGSNHNKDLETALKLIEIAAEAGANAIKFQLFKANTLYSKKTPIPSYLLEHKLINTNETICDLISKLELPLDWLQKLIEHSNKCNLVFLCTPFDLEAVDILESISIKAYKIASFEITHIPLIRKVAKTSKPIILSTGMANLSDIEIALETILEAGGRLDRVALLHGAIGYPPPFEALNLKAIQTLKAAFNLPVGFTDHTLGYESAVAAVALGACIIEKHFTLSKAQQGPDHPFALEPHELKQFIKTIRNIESALGDGIKKHSVFEQELYKLARRSIVAKCFIKKDTIITPDMLEIKRPGYGIHPKFLEIIVGRKANRDIEEDEIITWDMI